jgi:hypothetical protein
MPSRQRLGQPEPAAHGVHRRSTGSMASTCRSRPPRKRRE